MLARSQRSVNLRSSRHLQQMVHDTHEFYSKIINEIWNISVLLLRLPLKTHIWSHRLMERVEQCYFKALKTGLVEKRDNQVLCQLTVKPKANVSCQLKFWPFVSCQLTPSRPSCESRVENIQNRDLSWAEQSQSKTREECIYRSVNQKYSVYKGFCYLDPGLLKCIATILLWIFWIPNILSILHFRTNCTSI